MQNSSLNEISLSILKQGSGPFTTLLRLLNIGNS